MRFARIGFTFVVGALAGLGATGCSSPTPPTEDGAYLVQFIGGSDCNVTGHNAAVGAITASVRSAVVADGSDGASVSCTVAGAGPYSVTGEIISGADNLSIRVDALPTTATKDDPAIGGAVFGSATTVKEFSATSSSMTPCNFYFVTGTPESVAPGKVWLAFSCGAVADGAGDTCKLNESYAILENCGQ